MGETRRREAGPGDPAATVEDLAPRTVLIREADVWRPHVGERVSWQGFPGKVIAIDGREADVELDEPLYAGGDRLVKLNIERLRNMDGGRPPASIKGMTIDAGKAALAAAAKELALAIHRKIGQVEALKAEYRNMVKVCELLGVPLDELPALATAMPRRTWTPEQRKAQSDRIRASNRDGRTGRGAKA
jgi:hypothetical protein